MSYLAIKPFPFIRSGFVAVMVTFTYKNGIRLKRMPFFNEKSGLLSMISAVISNAPQRVKNAL